MTEECENSANKPPRKHNSCVNVNLRSLAALERDFFTPLSYRYEKNPSFSPEKTHGKQMSKLEKNGFLNDKLSSRPAIETLIKRGIIRIPSSLLHSNIIMGKNNCHRLQWTSKQRGENITKVWKFDQALTFSAVLTVDGNVEVVVDKNCCIPEDYQINFLKKIDNNIFISSANAEPINPLCSNISKRNNIVSLSCGLFHCCILSENNEVFTFGRGKNGQLGHENFDDLEIAAKVCDSEFNCSLQKVDNKAISLKCGPYSTTVAVSDEIIWEWGNVCFFPDQLLQAQCKIVKKNKPSICKQAISIANNARIYDIEISLSHWTVLTVDGDLWTWGIGPLGQLGLGPHVLESIVPRQIMLPYKYNKEKIEMLSSGWDYTIAITEFNSILGWGNNKYGQCGYISVQNAIDKPTAISIKRFDVNFKQWKNVCCKGYTTILEMDGAFCCWGIVKVPRKPQLTECKYFSILKPTTFRLDSYMPSVQYKVFPLFGSVEFQVPYLKKPFFIKKLNTLSQENDEWDIDFGITSRDKNKPVHVLDATMINTSVFSLECSEDEHHTNIEPIPNFEIFFNKTGSRNLTNKLGELVEVTNIHGNHFVLHFKMFAFGNVNIKIFANGEQVLGSTIRLIVKKRAFIHRSVDFRNIEIKPVAVGIPLSDASANIGMTTWKKIEKCHTRLYIQSTFCILLDPGLGELAQHDIQQIGQLLVIKVSGADTKFGAIHKWSTSSLLLANVTLEVLGRHKVDVIYNHERYLLSVIVDVVLKKCQIVSIINRKKDQIRASFNLENRSIFCSKLKSMLLDDPELRSSVLFSPLLDDLTGNMPSFDIDEAKFDKGNISLDVQELSNRKELCLSWESYCYVMNTKAGDSQIIHSRARKYSRDGLSHSSNPLFDWFASKLFTSKKVDYQYEDNFEKLFNQEFTYKEANIKCLFNHLGHSVYSIINHASNIKENLCRVQSSDQNGHNFLVRDLRKLIIDRMKYSKKSIHEIFNHFDRCNRHRFNVIQLCESLKDLRLQAANEEIYHLFNIINIDCSSRICIGEFRTFILDPIHNKFWGKFCMEFYNKVMIVKKLAPQDLLLVFHNSQRSLNCRFAKMVHSKCTWNVFLCGLAKLDIFLSSKDYIRLLNRFDTHGNGIIDLVRFSNSILLYLSSQDIGCEAYEVPELRNYSTPKALQNLYFKRSESLDNKKFLSPRDWDEKDNVQRRGYALMAHGNNTLVEASRCSLSKVESYDAVAWLAKEGISYRPGILGNTVPTGTQKVAEESQFMLNVASTRKPKAKKLAFPSSKYQYQDDLETIFAKKRCAKLQLNKPLKTKSVNGIQKMKQANCSSNRKLNNLHKKCLKMDKLKTMREGEKIRDSQGHLTKLVIL